MEPKVTNTSEWEFGSLSKKIKLSLTRFTSTILYQIGLEVMSSIENEAKLRQRFKVRDLAAVASVNIQDSGLSIFYFKRIV
jgi:hypothetical protein